MSSNEEDYDGESGLGMLHGTKKRRIQRACDICRRKKIRCDGVQMPGNRCSNCITYSFSCTYVEAAKKRGPPKGYVESLETRLEKLERLLQKLSPDGNLLKELDGNLDSALDSGPPRDPSALTSPGQPSTEMSYLLNSGYTTPKRPTQIATSAIRKVGSVLSGDHDDEEDNTATMLPDYMPNLLADHMEQMSLERYDQRFFGKSSGAILIQTAIELKQEYAGKDKGPPAVLGSKRSEFWDIRPWELAYHEPPPPEYKFPPMDLIRDLTNLYFINSNLFLPLLHRPSFERSIEEGLHLKSNSFGANVLLVCAVGARYSDDPRVLLEEDETAHSSGWKWFEQVQMVKKSLLAPPTLHDLQFYCLSVQFLQGSSAPQSCWTMVGFGIRLAQDVGAHRRKASNGVPNAEDELWKRVFWILVCMDRMISSALGRPCCIQDEDFDLEMPIECDDEYWEHPDPEQRFKQPPDKPSLITSFNLFIKLNQVLAFSLRTIYSINKSKILLGFVGPQWEQHIVAELDSALNKWVDSVPDHLRWDPNRENADFFHQSAMLYCSYYHIQIIIHRPFIPSPNKPSPLSFPSLAICTNAARSCSHVVDIQRKREVITTPHIQMAVFTSGIVLLLNIWGGKRSGLSTDPKKEMADVYKCMQVLRSLEKRWNSAGRLWDILYELASVGDLPLPQPSPPVTNKRERDAESPISTPTASSESTSSFDGPRNIAGSRRVQKDAAATSATFNNSQSRTSAPSNRQPQQPPLPRQQQNLCAQRAHPSEAPPSELFALPVYSDELGRLPSHGHKFPGPGPSPLDTHGYWYPPSEGSSDTHGPNSASSSHGHAPHNHSHSGFPSNTMSTVGSGFAMDESHMMYDPSMAVSYPPGSYGGSMDGLGSVGSFRGGATSSGMAEPIAHHQQHSNVRFGMPQHQQGYMDNDTIAMWSNAPTGFELDEWGTYLTNVSELTHGSHAGSGSQHGQGDV